MFPARKRVAAHPGEVLQMILIEHGITQTELARNLGTVQTKISEICRAKRGISAEMAMKLGKVLNMSPNIWLNLQKNWELSQVDKSKLSKVKPFKKISIDQGKMAA